MTTEPRQRSGTLDVRQRIGAYETVMLQGGGLFPVLTTTGDEVLAVVHSGAGHHGILGRLELLRSRDEGATWSAPSVVVDSEWDDRNPSFGRLASGTLVLAYLSIGTYAENGDYQGYLAEQDPVWRRRLSVTTSADDGYTWTAPRPLDLPELRGGSTHGRVVTGPNGTALLGAYTSIMSNMLGLQSRSFLVSSQDDGRSWDEPRLIASGMNETGLCCLPDGTLLAVMRSEHSSWAGSLFATRSVDLGVTWSEPVQVTGPSEHPADVNILANGWILVLFGNRRPPYRIEGVISRDGGRSWSDQRLLFTGPLYGVERAQRRTDLGYPSTALVGPPARRTGVTGYYISPTMADVEDIWRREGNPLFEPFDYRAVAIRWSEPRLLELLA